MVYSDRRPGWRSKEGVHELESTRTFARRTEKKGAWVNSRDEWCREAREEKREILRYRTRATVLGRSLEQDGQKEDVSIRRLEGLTVKVTEAAGSLLSILAIYGGRVGVVARQVRNALLSPHMEPQRINGSSRTGAMCMGGRTW